MPGRPRILVVDDEPQIHRFLGPALEAAGYEPVPALLGEKGLALLATYPPDALILDLGLPDVDGKIVLSRARAFYKGPVLILSARDREMEKINALDLGADDYVQKPFAVGELLARLRAAMRNKLTQEGAQAIVKSRDLEIDLIHHTVKRAGAFVRLTPREYNVLAQLVKAAGRVVTHRQLLISIWGPIHAEDVHYLRIVMQHLRQKLEDDPANPQLLLTAVSAGYIFAG